MTSPAHRACRAALPQQGAAGTRPQPPAARRSRSAGGQGKRPASQQPAYADVRVGRTSREGGILVCAHALPRMDRPRTGGARRRRPICSSARWPVLSQGNAIFHCPARPRIAPELILRHTAMGVQRGQLLCWRARRTGCSPAARAEAHRAAGSDARKATIAGAAGQ